MSASLIAKARARLPDFHDGTHLVHQLVGSHTWTLVRLADSASDSTKVAIRKATRQLLVKLKIIFDYQLSFFVLRDFDEHSLASAGLNIPDREFLFEATLYTLYLAADLEHPSTLGRNDYNVLRGLAFATILAVFRALTLHKIPFSEEESGVVSQRVGHLCQVWDSQQPLSMVEALVLRRVVPQTLENIRLHNGKSIIQTFCCGKCDQKSYLSGQVCRDKSFAWLIPWMALTLPSSGCCLHRRVESTVSNKRTLLLPRPCSGIYSGD